jgi:hypothetical protein
MSGPDLSLPKLAAVLAVLGASAHLGCTRSSPSSIQPEQPGAPAATASAGPPPVAATAVEAPSATKVRDESQPPLEKDKASTNVASSASAAAANAGQARKGGNNLPAPPPRVSPKPTGSASCGAGTCAHSK